MEPIRRKILAAHRRVLAQRFTHILIWTLSASLLVAAIGGTIPKIWEVSIPGSTWLAGWGGGALALALTLALAMTYWTRPSLDQTAMEVDHRFGLRERLSSALALDPQAAETEVGRALVEDAQQRAEKISIADQFRFSFHRRSLVPLLPAALLGALVFIPDATQGKSSLEDQAKLQSTPSAEIKTALDRLNKRLSQQRLEGTDQQVPEADEMFKNLQRQLNELQQRDQVDRKEVLVSINQMKDMLEERRKSLGSSEQMRRAMAGMEKIEEGPAEQVAREMEQGNFGKAEEKLRDLAQQLRDQSLTPEDQQRMAKQIERLQKNIQQRLQEHAEAKQQLQKAIEQAQREGRGQDAAKMQQQLQSLEQQDATMQQLQELSSAMEGAQQSIQQGELAEAAEGLEKMAAELGEMEADQQQLEELDDALQQLSQTKDQMGCQECRGQGCSSCSGNAAGNLASQMDRAEKGENSGQGNGQGAGQGQGERPEEASDTDFYDSQIRGQPKTGRTVVAGKIGGENRKGSTRQSVQEAIFEAISDQSDPLEDTNLPRLERAHAEEYFNRLREGKKPK